MEVIENISNQVTVLNLVHRFATLRNCNQIVEIENGNIKNIGIYNEIALKDGVIL